MTVFHHQLLGSEDHHKFYKESLENLKWRAKGINILYGQSSPGGSDLKSLPEMQETLV